MVCGGGEHCAPDYRIERRRFPFFCLEFVAGGSGRLELGGKSAAFSPGIVFTCGPSTPHTIVTDPNRPLLNYFVDGTGRAANRLLSAAGLKAGAITRAADSAVVVALFELLIPFGQEAGPRATHRCACLRSAARKSGGQRRPFSRNRHRPRHR